ncbi:MULTISPECIES: TMEM143 family protein [Rhodomicrobium]|uniref:TMEM143 family protein n=1 Tax=Rhodomicrobium TaxID=1068 RepID=UPI001482D3D8|nr:MULTISPECIES: TMEM143 family protein [Rhodomicrobium]
MNVTAAKPVQNEFAATRAEDASPIELVGPAAVEATFIPVSRSDIFEALLDTTQGAGERAKASEVLTRIGYLRQHKSGVILNQLSDIYDPFNPDDETVNVTEASEAERLEKRRMFHAKLTDLVTSANYKELSPHELEEILSKATPDGVAVEVDFKEYDVKLIFCRGESQVKKTKRDLKRLFLKNMVYDVPTYERLFLAIKFKSEDIRIPEIMKDDGIDEKKARKKLRKMRRMLPPFLSTDHIYIKIFKDIPRYDVEMLFPNIRVKMKYSDKLQLGGSAVFGTVTWALGTATKLFVAVALSPLVLAGTIVTGVGGIMYTQVRNVFITRDRYRMQLAQSLYFQNLANNQGALALIVDDAEEEDVKEEALLYMQLLRTPVHTSQLDTLRGRIDAFLKEKFDVHVRFDVSDALGRLTENGLVTQSPAGELRALPLDEAARHLRERWCSLLDPH